ncbi:hypothetical protein EDB86DRAFT_3245032 [Lactarius hatsudake]|nr:hypothetical protein EDB86DRAFT_3245032 [Lactarius hatsudake]
MTHWKSPAVITAEYFALVKLYHATWGLFLWEFVVNLGFEYSVFTGKRKFRSSFLLYLGGQRTDGPDIIDVSSPCTSGVSSHYYGNSGLSDYVHKEGDVHMSRGLPVRQPPIGSLVARSGRGSPLGTSVMLDGHMFEMDH